MRMKFETIQTKSNTEFFIELNTPALDIKIIT